MSQPRPDRRDRRRTMITPEGIALPITLASRGSRFGALMIDLIVMTLGFTAFNLLLGLIAALLDLADGKGPSKSPKSDPLFDFLNVAAFMLLFLFRHGYFLIFELGPRGSTPGKRMLGIRVAARDGGRLTTEMVLARNLLRDIELFLPIGALASLAGGGTGNAVILLWLLLFALLPFINRDRLRAGDLVAGSWVVERPRQKLEAVMSSGQTAATGTSQTTGASYRFSDAELAIYGELELQTLERVLRENRHEAMIAVHEAICRKIGWNPGAGDERAFLEVYYTQLRNRLESGMRMGKRKASKHE
ncbi:MAG: RDD family protein [Novosphingobium sp.]|uniref:RDD family protein n=1 Tax=Novosphingobium sp. TaxID=1874826 RepID=UPI0032BCEAE6